MLNKKKKFNEIVSKLLKNKKKPKSFLFSSIFKDLSLSTIEGSLKQLNVSNDGILMSSFSVSPVFEEKIGLSLVQKHKRREKSCHLRDNARRVHMNPLSLVFEEKRERKDNKFSENTTKVTTDSIIFIQKMANFQKKMNDFLLTSGKKSYKELTNEEKHFLLNVKDTFKDKKVYTSYSKISEIRLISIGLASNKKIRQWAEKKLPNGKILGEVTSANTLHHKTFKPLKGGLFCERIFGPLKDFECACNIQKRPNQEDYQKIIEHQEIKRQFCSICDVEYTWSIIRRYQMGFIKLISPVSHIWYLKAYPSYLSILLDIKRKDLEKIIYCSETLTLENSWKIPPNLPISGSTSVLFDSWKKINNHFVKKDTLFNQLNNQSITEKRKNSFPLLKDKKIKSLTLTNFIDLKNQPTFQKKTSVSISSEQKLEILLSFIKKIWKIFYKNAYKLAHYKITQILTKKTKFQSFVMMQSSNEILVNTNLKQFSNKEKIFKISNKFLNHSINSFKNLYFSSNFLHLLKISLNNKKYFSNSESSNTILLWKIIKSLVKNDFLNLQIKFENIYNYFLFFFNKEKGLFEFLMNSSKWYNTEKISHSIFISSLPLSLPFPYLFFSKRKDEEEKRGLSLVQKHKGREKIFRMYDNKKKTNTKKIKSRFNLNSKQHLNRKICQQNSKNIKIIQSCFQTRIISFLEKNTTKLFKNLKTEKNQNSIQLLKSLKDITLLLSNQFVQFIIKSRFKETLIKSILKYKFQNFFLVNKQNLTFSTSGLSFVSNQLMNSDYNYVYNQNSVLFKKSEFLNLKGTDEILLNSKSSEVILLQKFMTFFEKINEDFIVELSCLNFLIVERQFKRFNYFVLKNLSYFNVFRNILYLDFLQNQLNLFVSIEKIRIKFQLFHLGELTRMSVIQKSQENFSSKMIWNILISNKFQKIDFFGLFGNHLIDSLYLYGLNFNRNLNNYLQINLFNKHFKIFFKISTRKKNHFFIKNQSDTMMNKNFKQLVKNQLKWKFSYFILVDLCHEKISLTSTQSQETQKSKSFIYNERLDHILFKRNQEIYNLNNMFKTPKLFLTFQSINSLIGVLLAQQLKKNILIFFSINENNFNKISYFFQKNKVIARLKNQKKILFDNQINNVILTTMIANHQFNRTQNHQSNKIKNFTNNLNIIFMPKYSKFKMCVSEIEKILCKPDFAKIHINIISMLFERLYLNFGNRNLVLEMVFTILKLYKSSINISINLQTLEEKFAQTSLYKPYQNLLTLLNLRSLIIKGVTRLNNRAILNKNQIPYLFLCIDKFLNTNEYRPLFFSPSFLFPPLFSLIGIHSYSFVFTITQMRKCIRRNKEKEEIRKRREKDCREKMKYLELYFINMNFNQIETKKENSSIENSSKENFYKLSERHNLYKNHIYCLSFLEPWSHDKNWQYFSNYLLASRDFDDISIPIYKNQILNTIYISEEIRQNITTGAGTILKFVSEFHFKELKKMSRQNQFVLNELRGQIQYLTILLKSGFANKDDIIELSIICRKRDQFIRQSKLIQEILHKKTDPTSMILTILPVLPPDLRPILKIQNQIAASDLNRLYQRVLYRNDRLKKFRKDPALVYSFEVKYAQRLLQEAVDNLIQNEKGGLNAESDSRGRLFKSLSESLKGKQGRFRQYLLGKRVDYSGRSVIVVGPKLRINECGLPKEMALELFLPFLIKRIIHYKFAKTIIGAKNLIKTNKNLIFYLLSEIMQTHPILLNRAPTLHRLGIQAFQAKLIEGRAILLHPLVCSAFNADFDGDQMAVHIPLTTEARAESWKLMLSRNHLISAASGDPTMLPSQDMVLGCYYLTTEPPSNEIILSSFSLSEREKIFHLDLSFVQKHKEKNRRVNKFEIITTSSYEKAKADHSKKRTISGTEIILSRFINKNQKLIKNKTLDEIPPALIYYICKNQNVESLEKNINIFRKYIYFNSFDDVLKTYLLNQIKLHSKVWVKWKNQVENGHKSSVNEIRMNLDNSWQEIHKKQLRYFNSNNQIQTQYIQTTPGRILFYKFIQQCI